MKRAIVLAVIPTSAIALSTAGQQAQRPMSEEEVLKVVKKFKKDLAKAVAIIGERTIDFDATLGFTEQIKKLGADRSVFEAVVEAAPSARSLTTLLGKRIQVAPSEKAALIAVENEISPDRRLGIIEDFKQNFPSSPLLSYLFSQSAKSYEQKGGHARAVDDWERSIELDPDNIFGLSMLALILVQPKALQGSAAEIERRISDAESYTKRTLQLADQMSPQDLAKDPDLQKRKASLGSDLHLTLGMAYLDDDDYATAADQFKASNSLANPPSPITYFRVGEAYESNGKLDLAVDAFRTTSDLGNGTVVKTNADKKLEDLKLRK
jgi:tetratricopeptide (TPR) repeat protein